MTTPAGLDDDEPLTQYVFVNADPQNAPRPRDFDGLSMLRGRLDASAAARYIRKARVAYAGDTVRYTTVGALVAADFVVQASPGRKNPLHVSVSYEAEWTDDVSETFAECFDETSNTGEVVSQDE